MIKEEALIWAWFAANAPKRKWIATGKVEEVPVKEQARFADDMLEEYKRRLE